MSYPADKFVIELKQILGTTDVGKIQRELQHIICSDVVLNLGLEAFLREWGRSRG